MTEDNQALIPIAEALPELRAEQYAQVRKWDAERMALEGEYEAADGEYLKKIRDALKGKHGLWTAYLRARDIPERTARQRIQAAEGRYIRSKPATVAGLPEPPMLDMVMVPSKEYKQEQNELARYRKVGSNMGYYGEPIDGYHDPYPEVEPEEEDSESWPPEEASMEDWPPIEKEEESIRPEISHSSVIPEVPPRSFTPKATSYSIKTWTNLPQSDRANIITAGRNGNAGLNRQDTDSIEWARWSWNPVTGCLHNCPYCYARDIANRFYPQGFTPTFYPERLGAPSHQRVPQEAEHELGYRNIFTCSMADLFGKWVPAEWIEAVLHVARDNPQWNFLFLTKFPNRLAEFTYPNNAWLGTSVDCQARVKNAEQSFARVKGGVKWLSVEPMLEPLHFTSLDMFNWVVIGGASSSNQTPAWSPPRQWVDDFEADARTAGCMIYEKTNLQSRLREYPGWQRPEQELPEALRYLPSIGN